MSERSHQRTTSSPLVLERNLALIFALLGVLLTTVFAGHWLLNVEPMLRADAESRSRALAQAQARGIETILTNDSDPRMLVADLETTLDAILLFKDPATQSPLIRGVELALDYELRDLATGSLDIVRGERDCADCFVTEVPLYDLDSQLLIGIATIHSSPRTLQDLIRDVRGALVWVGGAMLLLIGLAWIGASRVLRRLGTSESNLRTLFEAAPYPMILSDLNTQAILRANTAATDYLGLHDDGRGHLDSPVWRALLDSGLPSHAGDRHEVRLPDTTAGERWAIVSSMPIDFSDGTRRLLSFADVSAPKAVQHELHTASITDGLTGLYNRRHLLERLASEIGRSRRHDHPLSVILFDLDGFKGINDRYGHRIGDEVLVGVAGLLRSLARETDISGRYGGEEFLVILPDTDAREAATLANRIREAIKTLTWSEPALKVTISGGIGEYLGTDIDELIERADQKLYRAKAAGRDRIIG